MKESLKDRKAALALGFRQAERDLQEVKFPRRRSVLFAVVDPRIEAKSLAIFLRVAKEMFHL